MDHFGRLGGTWGAISPVRPSRESGFEPAAVPWPASNWTAPISSQVRLQIIANFQTVSYIWIVFLREREGKRRRIRRSFSPIRMINCPWILVASEPWAKAQGQLKTNYTWRLLGVNSQIPGHYKRNLSYLGFHHCSLQREISRRLTQGYQRTTCAKK